MHKYLRDWHAKLPSYTADCCCAHKQPNQPSSPTTLHVLTVESLWPGNNAHQKTLTPRQWKCQQAPAQIAACISLERSTALHCVLLCCTESANCKLQRLNCRRQQPPVASAGRRSVHAACQPWHLHCTAAGQTAWQHMCAITSAQGYMHTMDCKWYCRAC